MPKQESYAYTEYQTVTTPEKRTVTQTICVPTQVTQMVPVTRTVVVPVNPCPETPAVYQSGGPCNPCDPVRPGPRRLAAVSSARPAIGE